MCILLWLEYTRKCWTFAAGNTVIFKRKYWLLEGSMTTVSIFSYILRTLSFNHKYGKEPMVLVEISTSVEYSDILNTSCEIVI